MPLGVVSMFGPVAAHADGASIAAKGVGSVAACSSCHGAAGEGNAAAGFPRLAGLSSAYLQRQLEAFTEGQRKNVVMMATVKTLAPADRVAVADYYAALPVPASAAPVSAPAPDSAGALLATRGRWSDGLPACAQCHGPGGRGVGADFPALAGQSALYLSNQLHAWKQGARPPGPLALMQAVSAKLSEADIRDVSDYFAALPATEVKSGAWPKASEVKR